MKVNEAYNIWANTYDVVENKTRDVEALALRTVLKNIDAQNILELGCGTGKNTEWLATKATSLTAADFSVEMINIARQKNVSDNVSFVIQDITEQWNFNSDYFQLITCSLILEHIENLNHIFEQANKVLTKEGLFYIGELHPFKQYLGSKARFEVGDKTVVLNCYTHHISAFFKAAVNHNFECIDINEWFDEIQSEQTVPRILAMLFRKK